MYKRPAAAFTKLLPGVFCVWAVNFSAACASPVFDAITAKRYGDALFLARNADALTADYARWAALSQPGGEAYLSFSEAVQFFRARRHWPLSNRVQLSVEAAQLRDGAAGDDARWMCDEVKPISGRGMIACANLLSPGDTEVARLVRQAWMQGDFDAAQEREIRTRYGALLDSRAHAARVERLLFEKKTAAALRVVPHLAPKSRSISEARIALISGAKAADAKIAALSASARQSAGVLFDRIRYRHRKGMEQGALDLFVQCPINPPHANEWWPLRHYYAREAMQNGQYSKALQIIGKVGDVEPEYMAEALWLSGWLHYAYLNQPGEARIEFEKLYRGTVTPVSRARGAYWAGRAAQAIGDTSEANTWFERASAYPTVFYGQLAYAALYPGKPLVLPERIRAGSARNGTLAQIAMLLDQNNCADARLFWKAAAQHTDDESALAALAEQADSAKPGNGVRVAKEALRKNIVLLDQGWPRIGLPENLAVEPALALAITRQESEFDPRARSSANAQGLMQLLPGTARQVAREQGLPGAADLFSPHSNIRLGSAYLGQLIGRMGGSYVAAIAGYNAGPGNVLKWMSAYGRPGESVDATLRWLEMIPFGETRNYVQRVLENLQVYRALERPDAPLAIEQDLRR